MGCSLTTTELTPKQVKTIKAILESRTYTEAVKQAKVGKATLYEWLKDPLFKAELDDRLKKLIDCSLNQLKGASGIAVDTLVKCLKKKDPNLQYRASVKILDFVLKLREHQEFEERLDKLEKIVNEKSGNK